MALLTYIALSKVAVEIEAQLTAADAGATGDDTIDSSNNVFFAVKNNAGADRTVTIPTPVASTQTNNFGSLPVVDLEHLVPAGELHIFKIPQGYADAGKWTFTYDNEVDVLIGGFNVA